MYDLMILVILFYDSNSNYKTIMLVIAISFCCKNSRVIKHKMEKEKARPTPKCEGGWWPGLHTYIRGSKG